LETSTGGNDNVSLAAEDPVRPLPLTRTSSDAVRANTTHKIPNALHNQKLLRKKINENYKQKIECLLSDTSKAVAVYITTSSGTSFSCIMNELLY
jgi:hypothetical protein